jgi:hypothetical protein
VWYYAKDGQQAGPIAQDELQGYFRDNRLALDTNVWRDGMANWMPANQVPDLMAGVSGGMLTQPAAGAAPYMQVQPQPTNSMALTSMILGLLGLFVAWIFTAIPAVICGHIARKQIRTSGGLQTGDGMALTGLITGYLVIVLTILMVIGFVVFLFVVMDATSSSSGPVYSPTPPPAPPLPPAPAIP